MVPGVLARLQVVGPMLGAGQVVVVAVKCIKLVLQVPKQGPVLMVAYLRVKAVQLVDV